MACTLWTEKSAVAIAGGCQLWVAADQAAASQGVSPPCGSDSTNGKRQLPQSCAACDGGTRVDR